MKRHLLNIAITASSLLALTACSDDVMMQENNNLDKSPIELSVGGVESASTRAVVTDGTATEELQQGTGVFMLMKSEYSDLTGEYAFYDYGGSHDTKYATTRGNVKNNGTDIEFSNDQTITRTRYWDDAHARSSKLSIWAVACDGLNALGGTGTSLDESSNIFNTADAKTLWGTTAINATSLDWNVPTSGEDATSVKNRDLIFSNNVTKHTINSVETDNRTSFSTDSKKFGSSALVFYHALSKITVYLDKGDGYTSNDAFSFPDNKNIKLNYFNVGGKFNIEQGEFTEVNKLDNNDGHSAIDYIYNKTGATPSTGDHAYELQALVLPYLSSDTKTFKGSQFVENNTNIMMEFSIDGSNYRLTSGALYDALIDKTTNNPVDNATQKTDNGTYIPLEAGKNYVFTFIVTKTGIEATATVKPWDDVTASDVTPLINFSKCYGSTGDNFGKGFTFYRSTSKDSNYLETNNSSSVTYNSTGTPYTMSPKLYWQDHSTHYFFRGIWPAKGTEDTQTEINNGYTPIANITTSTDNKTVVDVQNVGYKNGTFPSDLMIGVPRKTETIDDKEVTTYDETCKAGHTTEGAATSGICATQATTGSHDNEGLIHMNFQYAMSQVEVRLTTPTTGDDAKAKVRLEGAKVEIVDGYTEGYIQLGNEEAVPTGNRVPFEIPEIASTEADRDGIDKANIRHAAVVPQDLTWTESSETKYLRFKVTITNDDGTTDIYYTDIEPIKKSDQTKIAPNGKWEAGTHYVYTLDIKKTGIEGITATITNWKKVTATESVWF